MVEETMVGENKLMVEVRMRPTSFLTVLHGFRLGGKSRDK